MTALSVATQSVPRKVGRRLVWLPRTVVASRSIEYVLDHDIMVDLVKTADRVFKPSGPALRHNMSGPRRKLLRSAFWTLVWDSPVVADWVFREFDDYEVLNLVASK